MYTSRHFVYGTLIVNCWREYVKILDKKAEEKKAEEKEAEEKVQASRDAEEK